MQISLSNSILAALLISNAVAVTTTTDPSSSTSTALPTLLYALDLSASPVDFAYAARDHANTCREQGVRLASTLDIVANEIYHHIADLFQDVHSQFDGGAMSPADYDRANHRLDEWEAQAENLRAAVEQCKSSAIGAASRASFAARAASLVMERGGLQDAIRAAAETAEWAQDAENNVVVMMEYTQGMTEIARAVIPAYRSRLRGVQGAIGNTMSEIERLIE